MARPMRSEVVTAFGNNRCNSFHVLPPVFETIITDPPFVSKLRQRLTGIDSTGSANTLAAALDYRRCLEQRLARCRGALRSVRHESQRVYSLASIRAVPKTFWPVRTCTLLENAFIPACLSVRGAFFVEQSFFNSHSPTMSRFSPTAILCIQKFRFEPADHYIRYSYRIDWNF